MPGLLHLSSEPAASFPPLPKPLHRRTIGVPHPFFPAIRRRLYVGLPRKSLASLRQPSAERSSMTEKARLSDLIRESYALAALCAELASQDCGCAREGRPSRNGGTLGAFSPELRVCGDDLVEKRQRLFGRKRPAEIARRESCRAVGVKRVAFGERPTTGALNIVSAHCRIRTHRPNLAAAVAFAGKPNSS
jgi:hypothetical protein